MAVSFNRGLGFLPVLWGFYTVATIFLCYSLAVKHGHLYPYVPSVSHTGATSPERNIFALLFEFGAFWATVNLSVRYLQFDTLLKADQNCDRILNKIAFGFGLLSVIGLVFIANWPTPNVSKFQFLLSVMSTLTRPLFFTEIEHFLCLRSFRYQN